MNQPAPKVFDSETPLPDPALTAKAKTLLGFEERYTRVHNQLRLLLSLNELGAWNKKYHGGKLLLGDLVAEQYPLAIFHGDVGTGKSANAECLANRIVAEARAEDSILFKLSNRVRGSGKVGEMGTHLSEAFHRVTQSAGRGRRAVLIIDEGDSLATSRSQDHSHHEDKVAVNTLIQGIDDLRKFGGRVVTFSAPTVCLCLILRCAGVRRSWRNSSGRPPKSAANSLSSIWPGLVCRNHKSLSSSRLPRQRAVSHPGPTRIFALAFIQARWH
ncbi:AAA family ATPase [Bradyrhizobium sp. RDT10]